MVKMPAEKVRIRGAEDSACFDREELKKAN